jgi:hypothetical protein
MMKLSVIPNKDYPAGGENPFFFGYINLNEFPFASGNQG